MVTLQSGKVQTLNRLAHPSENENLTMNILLTTQMQTHAEAIRSLAQEHIR